MIMPNFELLNIGIENKSMSPYYNYAEHIALNSIEVPI